MGKGDKRTARGKIFRASYGKSRPSAAKATAARKAAGKAAKLTKKKG